MAIIYSYPVNTNILATDVILGTSTVTVNGKPKNQTKSFEIQDLASFINAGNTLNTVLQNGNTSLLDAKIGELYLYDSANGDYGKITNEDTSFVAYEYSGQKTFSASSTDSQFIMINANNKSAQFNSLPLTATRTYDLPDASGIIALTSDIPSLTGFVPYTGATSTVNLGVNDIDARWGLFNEVRLFDASYSTYGEIILQGESLFIKSSPTQVLANIDPGALGLLGYGPGGLLWEAKFTYTTLTADRTYALPNASGTIALTSNLTTNGTLFSAVSTTYQTAAGVLQSISSAISSSIFTNGNLLKLNAAITTTAASVAIVVIEFYINSAATISGATLIGRYNGPIGNLYIPIDRFFWVSGATLYGRDFTASASTSTSNSAFAINSVAIPATQFYIITQVTTTSTDRAAISTIKIEKS